jgi:hypothetical protein
VLLAGCGGGSQVAVQTPTPSPRPPTRAELIDAALQKRAGRIERSFGRLGVRDARFVIEELGADRVSARLAYRIRGVAGEFGSPHTYALRGTRVGRRLGARDREPWEVGRVRREESEHFVAWVLDGAIAPLRTLAAGYARLQATLDEKLKDRYLVVVVPDGAAARAITRRIAGLEQLSAITDTQVRIGGPAERVKEVRSQRLIINAAAFAQSDPASQEQVVAHELTHAVLAPRTSTRAPGWLVEGVALYASGDDRRPEYFSLSRFPTLAGLALPDSIAVLTGEAQRAAYAAASAAAFYITDTYGEAALLELLETYSRRDLRGDRGDPRLTDRAMRRVLGIGLDEFQERLG